ncbi:hypothetical protein CMI41_04680 [Candidatus Pacearchaeota archaeon]|nr:hypothetical protein [Candidatus Pacearchaeota archaeon]
MKKISYRNKRLSLKPKVKPCDLPSIPEAEEGLSGSANIGIGRGFAAPGEPVMPPTHTEEEERPVFIQEEKKKFNKAVDYDKLMQLLIDMADEMDRRDESTLAGFADFLIKKVAQQKYLDYSLLFRDLLIKIVDSDIFEKDIILTKVTKEYNNLLKLYANTEGSMQDAKRKAYQGSVSKAKEYVK